MVCVFKEPEHARPQRRWKHPLRRQNAQPPGRTQTRPHRNPSSGDPHKYTRPTGINTENKHINTEKINTATALLAVGLELHRSARALLQSDSSPALLQAAATTRLKFLLRRTAANIFTRRYRITGNQEEWGSGIIQYQIEDWVSPNSICTRKAWRRARSRKPLAVHGGVRKGSPEEGDESPGGDLMDRRNTER